MKKYIALIMVVACAAAYAGNEISVNANLKVNKDAVQLQRNTGTILIDMAGTRYNTQVLTCTTTNQYLAKGSVANAGWFYMRNLSTNTTEKVYISMDGGVTTNLLLEAKEAMIGRFEPSALVTNFTAATRSGSCDFELTVVED